MRATNNCWPAARVLSYHAAMQDRPTVLELLAAVRAFLETDVVPALEGTKKFHARVAANVLAIVARELDVEAEQAIAEWTRLDDLLDPEPMANDPHARRAGIRRRNVVLCERIQRGDADHGAFRQGVIAHLRQTAREKLSVANPKLLEGER